MKSSVLPLTILLTAAAPPAATPAEPNPSAVAGIPEASADAEADKKVCRTQKATGSLTRRTRICMTAAQWREVHDRTRRGVDEMTSSASGGKECIVDEFGGCR